ncbi:Ribonucleases P MRP subunit pop1 [Lecanosticta acicola]|uniref:Ribonucleases P MRP subunit pop1 n=1 Tax=Lecanosticta acicola TaxID=111012 RepID=A0AAI9EEW1_9PEZI|nr:Ribonucleases P MRP subunit pop1 [Lecanosticta acicola]
MAQSNAPRPPPNKNNDSRKRKEHPTSISKPDNKRPKSDHRAKQRDARTLATQASSKAFSNGELDVERFVKAREYEVRALEEGMSRSKKALSKRAFQQVPKDLRRRTASHNAKRVPKRLQSRAKREMIEDNTPTVTQRRRKPTRHMRLRLETAKRLRALGAQRKASRAEDKGDQVVVKPGKSTEQKDDKESQGLRTRAPKVKKASAATPPLPKAKFRKRQKSKTWLPTHMFHAKRARMTPPKEPLWRFAIPLTPTEKSYRPTHRAANERGAVAWDMSYMSTMGLSGQQKSIQGIFKALGIGSLSGKNMFSSEGERWRNGTRIWEGPVFRRETPHQPIAPVTVVWCVPSEPNRECLKDESEQRKRQALMRVHPSAFWQLWEEVMRLSKVAKPQVVVEDLRFEVGSIALTGPGAVEALQGALWPSPSTAPVGETEDSIPEIWKSLAGMQNQVMLPQNVLLGFEVQDPRLHHPPRTIDTQRTPAEQRKLLETLATWPVDSLQRVPAFFNRRARLAAGAALASQKVINRRKSAAAPGQYPEQLTKDPRIPVLIYYQSSSKGRQATFTILTPWKCVQPVWYSIMYYPLSTGGQPRFGGLDEKRQLAFENSQPWFPGDFPGTQAGWEYEVTERRRREADWRKRPKSKRVNWEALDLGNGKKGEVGRGWACDWERLLSGVVEHDGETAEPVNTERNTTTTAETVPANTLQSAPELMQMSVEQANAILQGNSESFPESSLSRSLVTVRVQLLVRGVPQTCARIYRLPSASSGKVRKRWLDLRPEVQAKQKKAAKNALSRTSKDVPGHLRIQRLAQSLIAAPTADDDDYPLCPGEEDLVGFVTTGDFNLGEGQGTGVGSILLDKVVEGVKDDPRYGRLCIVRNAGHGVGRLARWEIV